MTTKTDEQAAQRRREIELWRVCIADWTLRRCWGVTGRAGIVIRPPQDMAASHGLAETTTAYQGAETGSERMLYELCHALLKERDAYLPAPDAPKLVPNESIDTDADAMVAQHVRRADDYATLSVAVWNHSTQYAERRRMQAREDVADSARSLLMTTVRKPVR